MKIDHSYLSQYETQEIKRLLAQSPSDPPRLEDMWQLMDRVWTELGCNSKHPDSDAIEEFYRHPVWILNGFFIEQHLLSMQHRNAVADWIVQKQFARVLDYGGGFGTLARLIAERNQQIGVDVFEPYPSGAALAKAKQYPNVRFYESIGKTEYDCAIVMDVFEHVPDPLKLLAELTAVVNSGGSLIIANHFYPSTKCHLPTTFHLRYTFKLFAWLMGLRSIGPCQGSHAVIYEKSTEDRQSWTLLRGLETLSRTLFPIFRAVHPLYRGARRTIR